MRRTVQFTFLICPVMKLYFTFTLPQVLEFGDKRAPLVKEIARLGADVCLFRLHHVMLHQLVEGFARVRNANGN